jgi:limonene-1,2-epoxide hydrolase
MSDNSALVRDFIDAFNAIDLDRIMSFFSDDAVYHNMPVAPVSGPEAIRGVLQGFMGMASQVDWVLHDIAESAGGRVLTERTDRFLVGEKWVELPVMGSFDIADGRITAWRDYFDMNQFQAQLAGDGA